MEGILNIFKKWRFEIFRTSAVSRGNRVIHGQGNSCPGPHEVCSTKTWFVRHHTTTSHAKSNIAITAVNGARTDHETRPKNIRVVYIMKVF